MATHHALLHIRTLEGPRNVVTSQVVAWKGICEYYFTNDLIMKEG